jgi:RimK family alpha-L-glutamate ligase
MSTFALVATRLTPTNARLGTVLAPARALSQLRPGDVALGRLDVLPSLDGVESGLWALDRLEELGVTVLNRRAALVAAHDKLATANLLAAADVAHPRTLHVAPWLPLPDLQPPVVLKPRFGSWGRDVIRCDTTEELERALDDVRSRPWFEATGGVLQRLVTPRGYDLRIVVAGDRVVGAVKRVAAAGEWRTNVALGGHREPVLPPADACELALAAAASIGGDLVGVDLLPAGVGTWTVIEVNGAVDFTGAYALGDEIFAATRATLEAVADRRSVGSGNRAAAERVGTWTSRPQQNATTRTSSTRAR